eukprot:2240671-Alexandrium_andersonii.AAC.1
MPPGVTARWASVTLHTLTASNVATYAQKLAVYATCCVTFQRTHTARYAAPQRCSIHHASRVHLCQKPFVL